ncbi:MAG: hypothetical protein KDE35_07940 [Geminicoccaceae bacterium]|nr:hypothetical protein [Geminicoccaceae bacterium]
MHDEREKMRAALMRASAMLDEEVRLQGCAAADRFGNETCIESEFAVRFCLYGAVARELLLATGRDGFLHCSALLHRAARIYSGRNDIDVFIFNDLPTTTLDDVRAVLYIAVQLLDGVEPTELSGGSPRTDDDAPSISAVDIVAIVDLVLEEQARAAGADPDRHAGASLRRAG